MPPGIKGFHRHIPSLQAHAAIAAQPQIDIDLCSDKQSRKACKRARERLCNDLLRYCDRLYGEMYLCPSHTTSVDALWFRQLENAELTVLSSEYQPFSGEAYTCPIANHDDQLSLMSHCESSEFTDVQSLGAVALSINVFYASLDMRLRERYIPLASKFLTRFRCDLADNDVALNNLDIILASSYPPKWIRDFHSSLGFNVHPPPTQRMNSRPELAVQWYAGTHNLPALMEMRRNNRLDMSSDVYLPALVTCCMSGDADVLTYLLDLLPHSDRIVEGTRLFTLFDKCIRRAIARSHHDVISMLLPLVDWVSQQSEGVYVCDDITARILIENCLDRKYLHNICRQTPDVTRRMCQLGVGFEQDKSVPCKIRDPDILDVMIECGADITVNFAN